MTAEQFVFLVNLKIKPNLRAKFQIKVEDIIQEMSREHSFIGAHLLNDDSDPTRFALFEQWNSKTDFIEIQHKRLYRQHFDSELASMLARPREVQFWNLKFESEHNLNASIFSKVEHIGLTVPDLKKASNFLINVMNCRESESVGASDNWFGTTRKKELKMPSGTLIELHEVNDPDFVSPLHPLNCDIYGHHIAFSVKNIEDAVSHLRRHDVKVLGEPVVCTEGPLAGLSFVYFLTPWGLKMELNSK